MPEAALIRFVRLKLTLIPPLTAVTVKAPGGVGGKRGRGRHPVRIGVHDRRRTRPGEHAAATDAGAVKVTPRPAIGLPKESVIRTESGAAYVWEITAACGVPVATMFTAGPAVFVKLNVWLRLPAVAVTPKGPDVLLAVKGERWRHRMRSSRP